MDQLFVYPLRWNAAQKIAFRFFFVYFLLYVVPFDGWNGIIPWVGEAILHLPYPITVFPNGSGDTTFNYVQLLCFAGIAMVVTGIWLVVDRSRSNYNTLLYWLVVLLRYYLAFTMLTYGFAKVFKTQFPSPDLLRLLQPYGQSSPMGLAWTFMGYSGAYNWFTGLGEIVGGGLLLFRRTTALGSITLLVVLSNIVAINFCFDIPVKLFSSNLLLMTVFILAAEGKRLINVLLLNRPAPALDLTPFRTSRRWRTGRLVFKTVLLVVLFYQRSVDGFNSGKEWGEHAPKTPLYGIYQVETFALNSDTLAPMLTDSIRWRQVIVDGYKRYPHLTVRLMSDSLHQYVFKPDSIKSEAILYTYADTTTKYRITYVQPDTSSVIIRGVFGRDSIYARLKRQNLNQFLLINRGFHWINEYPMNR
ncbi:hypothetical protein [Spirosoma utsteinense]|uniref:Membrane protein YphA (DoxX/SURF4 family) n=1 Tax=Spirosoma utsteinense TaxID=2585773 RepID=A0ABR6W805_9BACT|nr:hypothetical protein [Spirosoma utsteinense]MBC3787687.1 putative membrane protein YphA (DoxX/SURF4 family) [Spirosoma utsteinense]MBC3792710.1 putative membrane protein YphA (DoxX/SURF4 family) [Spirosoma utsteinense]